jgi:hypothetical protein
MLELGYTVTELVPAHPERTGVVSGTKPKPEGGTSVGRVTIQCDGQGAVVTPHEDALLPNYDFSRVFGYSFKTLVQRPDREDPGAALGLEVLVDAIGPHEAVLDLGGVPTTGGAVPVRVTIRNNTDRIVAVDPARIDLVPAGGRATGPLLGTALDAVLAPGAAAERVRREQLSRGRVAANTTVTGFLVYPAGAYAEASVAIEDVETGETEGFVTRVQ